MLKSMKNFTHFQCLLEFYAKKSLMNLYSCFQARDDELLQPNSNLSKSDGQPSHNICNTGWNQEQSA